LAERGEKLPPEAVSKSFSELPDRALAQKKKKLAKLEQVLRSKIWPDLMRREGGGELKGANQARVEEYKKAWSEEKIWQSEESASEYKIGLIVAYGAEWGRARMEELIYFHLTNEMSESEKFSAVKLL